MAWRTRTKAFSVAMAWGALAVAGCDGAALLGPTRPFPSTANADVGDGETDCPREIPPDDCVPLNQAERTEIYWDINNSIKWFHSACAAVGSHAQDFILHGDVRKYHAPSPNFWVGYYQERAPGTGQRQISYDLVYHQGWSTGRTSTFMHEATHSYRNMGTWADTWDPTGPGTYWVEDNCINW